MARFRVGQRVVYTDEMREKVRLPREVNALVMGVYHVIRNKPPMYAIGWLPTGRAIVLEHEIRERLMEELEQ